MTPTRLGTTIPATLAAAAERFGNRVAVQDGAMVMTYVELQEAARGVAASLVRSGVAAGDVVAIWAPNSAE